MKKMILTTLILMAAATSQAASQCSYTESGENGNTFQGEGSNKQAARDQLYQNCLASKGYLSNVVGGAFIAKTQCSTAYYLATCAE
jgi:hypothetical protein